MTTPTPQPQGEVLVRLHRPEGYEDVHAELVLQDAHIHPALIRAYFTHGVKGSTE